MPATVSRRAGGALERARRPPPTPKQVRRTRGWMIMFLLTPVCLIVAVLFAYGLDGQPEPVVHPVSVPAGYQAITDAYYGYAVPGSYQQNPAWTDDNGDWFYGTPAHGFVAEAMLVTKRSPTAATAPPPIFEVFAEPKLVSYRVTGGHAVRIPDTTFAYEVDITRPGGWHAVAVDTWLRDSTTQMWLLVKASPQVTQAVIASLRGS